jgi:hypothetical protein
MLDANKGFNAFKGMASDWMTMAKDMASKPGFTSSFGGSAVGAYMGYQNSPDHPYVGMMGGAYAGSNLGAGLYNLSRAGMNKFRGTPLPDKSMSMMSYAKVGGMQLGIGGALGYFSW